MKAVILSDPHFHSYRAFNQDGRRLKNIARVVEEAWDKAAELNGMLWIPGDIFNNHQVISTQAAVIVIELFKRKAKQHPNVTVLFISGNHDYATKNMYDKPAVSAVHALVELSNNVVCLDNGVYNGGDFDVYGVPYYPDPADLHKAIGSIILGDFGTKILLIHQTVGIGISLVPDDIAANDPLFDGFDAVFNGHVHTYSKVNAKFYNVGTPIHRDAGDIGKDKGYLIFDTESGEVERVITTGYPVFRKVPDNQSVPPEWDEDYILFVPAQIEVTLEEKEIRDRFDHNRLSRAELLKNYLAGKDSNDQHYKYGNELLAHADKL